MVLTKWTTNLTAKFISLYKAQECLWKTEDPAYRDKDARDAALAVIWERMDLKDLDLDDVKRKIKYLRSTYMVEINKIEKSLKSGKSYKPCLVWFNQMDSFIRPQIRKSSCHKLTALIKNPNADIPARHSQEDSESDQPTETDRVVTSWHTGTEQQQKNRPYTNHSSHSSDPSTYSLFQTDMSRDPLGLLLERTMEPTTSSSSKRYRKEHELNQIQDTKSSIEPRNKAEDNEFDVFGKYVAIQLRSLYEEDAIIAQEEIQSILTRYRLKKVRWNYENYEATKSEMF